LIRSQILPVGLFLLRQSGGDNELRGTRRRRFQRRHAQEPPAGNIFEQEPARCFLSRQDFNLFLSDEISALSKCKSPRQIVNTNGFGVAACQFKGRGGMWLLCLDSLPDHIVTRFGPLLISLSLEPSHLDSSHFPFYSLPFRTLIAGRFSRVSNAEGTHHNRVCHLRRWEYSGALCTHSARTVRRPNCDSLPHYGQLLCPRQSSDYTRI
jgi:hypothetical protein